MIGYTCMTYGQLPHTDGFLALICFVLTGRRRMEGYAAERSKSDNTELSGGRTTGSPIEIRGY